MSDGWLVRLNLGKSQWTGFLSLSEAGWYVCLALMMRFNDAMREEEMNSWADRCIEDLKRIDMDLD